VATDKGGNECFLLGRRSGVAVAAADRHRRDVRRRSMVEAETAFAPYGETYPDDDSADLFRGSVSFGEQKDCC
jgi:hypothetical protein